MNNIKSILILTVGIIIGISFTNLFKGCGKEANPITTVKNVKPSVIEKHVAEAEQKFQQKIDSLNATSNQLNMQLTSTKKTLTAAKNKNLILQTQVYDLIDKPNTNTDTSNTDSNCDSLEIKVVELIHSNNEKDNLYEDINANMEAQVKNKDSTIQVKDVQYQTLKSSFTESIAQQQSLYDQNKSYQKQFKRQKVKSKLLTAALLILSGVAANYLIHH